MVDRWKKGLWEPEPAPWHSASREVWALHPAVCRRSWEATPSACWAQTNFGGILTMDGVPLGKHLARYAPRRNDENRDGSCVMVISTDAPLDARQLKRLARRAACGNGADGRLVLARQRRLCNRLFNRSGNTYLTLRPGGAEAGSSISRRSDIPSFSGRRRGNRGSHLQLAGSRDNHQGPRWKRRSSFAD